MAHKATARRPDSWSCRRWSAGALLSLAASMANAAEPGHKDLFGQSAPGNPYTLTFERPGQYLELTGTAERRDGSIWVTGYLEDQTGGTRTSSGYLAVVRADGTLGEEYEFALPDAAATQFWWATELADGRTAVAAALDPFTEKQNGALLILRPDGSIDDQVMLTDLGLSSGEIIHVEAYPNGDLSITGSAALSAQTNGAMTARLGPDLSLQWMTTDPARDESYTLSGYASSVLPDGSVVAIGTATDAGYIEGYGWLARFDSDGNQIWQQWLTGGFMSLIGNSAQVYGNWVDVLPNGNIAYLQTSYDDYGSPLLNMLVRLTPEGVIVMQAPMVFARQMNLLALTATRNGDVIVAGDMANGEMPIIARIDPAGSVIWQQSLDDLPGGLVWSVMETADGAIVAAGTYRTENGNGAGWVARMTADGGRP